MLWVTHHLQYRCPWFKFFSIPQTAISKQQSKQPRVSFNSLLNDTSVNLFPSTLQFYFNFSTLGKIKILFL